MRKILEADDSETLFYRAGKLVLRGWITGTMDTYMDTKGKEATA